MSSNGWRTVHSVDWDNEPFRVADRADGTRHVSVLLYNGRWLYIVGENIEFAVGETLNETRRSLIGE